jgi:hypothetical protein
LGRSGEKPPWWLIWLNTTAIPVFQRHFLSRV